MIDEPASIAGRGNVNGRDRPDMTGPWASWGRQDGSDRAPAPGQNPYLQGNRGPQGSSRPARAAGRNPYLRGHQSHGDDLERHGPTTPGANPYLSAPYGGPAAA